MGIKFYHEDRMSQARASLEARVLLWPDVEPTFLLDCPAYLVGGHPFAVLVDRALLLPRLPPEALQAAPSGMKLEPLRAGYAHLEGWLRLPVQAPEHVIRALALVRASFETVRAAAKAEKDKP